MAEEKAHYVVIDENESVIDEDPDKEYEEQPKSEKEPPITTGVDDKTKAQSKVKETLPPKSDKEQPTTTAVDDKTKTQTKAKETLPPKYPNIDIGNVVNERWKIIELLGSGGFGAVYRVETEGKRGKIEAAMKIEGTKKWRILTFKDSTDPKQRRLINCPEVLRMEVSVLKKMNMIKCPNVCTLYDQGKNDFINYIVVSLIGKDMRATQLAQKSQTFSLSTTIRTSLQTLEALKSIHTIGFLHRDIKPQNFAIGIGKEIRTVFMLDFGLARRFITQDGKNLPARSKCNFRGTPYYASYNVHKGLEQGPHDDLWSWFYMMIDFYHGQLPWARAERDKLGEAKEKINPFKLIQSLPHELFPIHKHLTSLKYPTIPKYPKIIYCLEQIIERFNIKENEPYDWEVTEQSEKMPKAIKIPTGAVMKTYKEYTKLFGQSQQS